MSSKRIELYGADWCLKSSNLRNYMQSQWIEFDDFNVETDKDAEERVRKFYDGKLKFPTVVIDGKHIKNPSLKELDKFLEENS